MKFSELYPSKYLQAADLDGQELTLVIAEVTVEELGRNKDRKPVLYFQNEQKGMACNKTNGRKISDMYGEDSDDWVGKEVTLYPALTTMDGEEVDCIRVKGPPKAQQSRRPVPADIKPPGGNAPRKAVVQDRGSYKLSTTQPSEEDMAGNG